MAGLIFFKAVYLVAELPGKILIIHPGALGDVSIVLSFVLKLRNKGHSVSLLTQSWLYDLKNVFPFVEAWESIDSGKVSRLFADDFLPEEFGNLRRFNRIFAFFKRGAETLKRNLEAIGVPFVCESFIPPKNFNGHITEHLEKIFWVNPDWDLNWRNTDDIHNGTAVIHPGSGNRLKNWALDRYLSLAKRLRNSGRTVLFITGPAEAGMVSRIMESGHRVVDGAPLSEVVNILTKAEFFIGNDSGLAHIAGFLGVNTLALFGPTTPRVWKPSGGRVHILYRPPHCSPCVGTMERIHCNENRCMNMIEVADVMAVLSV
ncbi:MAG TPA: glycosyltransferase family 9 protein [bacterium]